MLKPRRRSTDRTKIKNPRVYLNVRYHFQGWNWSSTEATGGSSNQKIGAATIAVVSAGWLSGILFHVAALWSPSRAFFRPWGRSASSLRRNQRSSDCFLCVAPVKTQNRGILEGRKMGATGPNFRSERMREFGRKGTRQGGRQIRHRQGWIFLNHRLLFK